jgi:hypothetical protein
MTRPIVSQKTSEGKAEGRLPKSFGIGRLFSASVIVDNQYTQSPFIRTSLIRTSAEFLGKFKTRALGGSNLRTTSKNLRTASAQIFKAKNQFVDESIVDGPQKRSK